MKKQDYHYTECGLDNVVVADADFDIIDDEGEKIIQIPAVGMLHKAIAEGLINQSGALSGAEIRFLRTEMGMIQAELAKLLHRDTQSVGRWERDECPIEPTQDMTLRQIARDNLSVSLSLNTVELSALVTPQASQNQIKIRKVADAKNPYQSAA